MILLDKEKLLSHIKKDEERIVLSRVLDTAQLVLRDHKTRVTDFLDPYHTGLSEDILVAIPNINFDINGGYQGAERKRIAITPKYKEPGWEDFKICHGVARPRSNGDFSHRDYLGGMLGTGMRREKVGDLIVFSGECQFVVDSGIFDYLELNWDQVGKCAIDVYPLQPEEWKEPEEEIKVIQASVSSLRLDAVAAKGFGLSRGKLAQFIKGERLRLNWRPITSPSSTIKEGDIISFRGYGRLVVSTVKGRTRKGRILVEIEKYR